MGAKLETLCGGTRKQKQPVSSQALLLNKLVAQQQSDQPGQMMALNLQPSELSVSEQEQLSQAMEHGNLEFIL